MPTLPTGYQDTVLFYEDGGIPGSSTDYVTIVLVHGAMFHGGVFRQVLPYAAKYKVRLVLMNLRDYPGSSRYSPEEIDALRGPEHEAQASAIRARGLEISGFLRAYIEKEAIPPVSRGSDGSISGGLVLVPWSAGNTHVLSVLANADRMPRDTSELLEKYMRSVILYDPSTIIAGAPPLDAVYSVLRDTTLSPDEHIRRFKESISSYFTPVDDLIPVVGDATTHPMVKFLQSRKPVEDDPSRTPTVQRMGAETVDSVTDPDVMTRSQFLYGRIELDVYRGNLRRALFPHSFPDAAEKAITWPNVDVHLVWCDMTVADCVWGPQWIQVLDLQNNSDKKGRDVRYHKLAGGNHFIHWDEPERFLQTLVDYA